MQDIVKPTFMGSCLLVIHVSPVYLVDEKEGSEDNVIEGSEDAALVLLKPLYKKGKKTDPKNYLQTNFFTSSYFQNP